MAIVNSTASVPTVRIKAVQTLSDDWYVLKKTTFELLRSDLRLVKRLRVDQVAHGFSLGKIDAAIEKCAHGELSGLSQPRPRAHAHLDNMPQHHRRSVR